MAAQPYHVRCDAVLSKPQTQARSPTLQLSFRKLNLHYWRTHLYPSGSGRRDSNPRPYELLPAPLRYEGTPRAVGG